MSSFLDEHGVGLGGNSVGSGIETRVMAKALAGLFAAGATLSLLTILLPHSTKTNEIGLLAIVVNAYVVAVVLFGRAETVRRWVLPVALGWGTGCITGVAYFSSESPSPLVFFYLWIFLYSSYFFSKNEAAAEIAWVGVLYGGLLAADPPETGIATWWIVGIGTLLVAAILISTMRRRVERLIARLYDAARVDPLTKLLNRRGFRELLDLELERGHRSGAEMAVVLGDVDYFKEVNDRSGHPVGDVALQRLAGVVEEGKRRIDMAARVGGEEFALILPETDQGGAFIIAERLRTAIQEEFAGDTVPITISFGIAAHPQHGETAGALLRAGDEALYAAKENGRNRTVVHSPRLREVPRVGPAKRDIREERYLAILLDLAEAVDLRFSGSARHSETVGRYAEMMAQELGLPEQRVNRVRLAGVLHDIGKVSVPDAILRKPGKLTEDEWAAIKKHPELGAQILEHPDLADVREWVGAHHERPDGKGYPLGVPAAKLALESRIIAVADAYEAMTSDRPYRPSLGHAAAREELRRCAGTQFDLKVVNALVKVLDRDSDRAERLSLAP